MTDTLFLVDGGPVLKKVPIPSFPLDIVVDHAGYGNDANGFVLLTRQERFLFQFFTSNLKLLSLKMWAYSKKTAVKKAKTGCFERQKRIV